MKIVHTSDWHVGRRWKGIQRLDEMEAVLQTLGDFIEKRSVDLVLHTGDVFDTHNPPADAEQLVNRFFVRIGRAGARMVLIAGNHDDPLRLDARGLLAEYANVEILGRPRRAERGGTRVVERADSCVRCASLSRGSRVSGISRSSISRSSSCSQSRDRRVPVKAPSLMR